LIAIRGAIAPVQNESQAICAAGLKLIRQICIENGLDASDLIMAQFSATSDLTAAYPAKGVREGGYTKLPMMCYQEMNVPGSIQGCIRIMVMTDKDNPSPRHVYLGDAETLRPDWVGEDNG
jgi:chorismate mutase